MFSRSGYSRAISAEIGDIDQRLRALERHLERVGSRSAASAAQAAERVGETIVSALQGMADRFQGGANSVRDEAAKIGRPVLASQHAVAAVRLGAEVSSGFAHPPVLSVQPSGGQRPSPGRVSPAAREAVNAVAGISAAA